MPKVRHEVRDVLYGFIEFDNLEKELIDSAPFQRLRGIHQLAMCYQVYPGATHKRFEHSLGVMEAATRIFDSVFNRRLSDSVHQRVESELEPDRKFYWRRVLRLAALLHDVGHLPFSHGAEEALLPAGWNHERLTAEIIRHSEIGQILRNARPMIDPEDVVDLAWAVLKRAAVEPSFALPPWKSLLNEIITGTTFGADRIDYLLRDSLHAGVAYGRFDPERLIGGLRAVLDPTNEQVTVGLDFGAIHAAEALLVARYFMYTQVYFHDVRRAYDMHLKEFLQAWLPGGKFATGWREIVAISDHEIVAALRSLETDPSLGLLAHRLTKRQHFRTVYEQIYTHKRKRPTIFQDLAAIAREAFGEENMRTDLYPPKSETNDFWVLPESGQLASSREESDVIAKLPPIEFAFLFVAPEWKEKGKTRIEQELQKLLTG